MQMTTTTESHFTVETSCDNRVKLYRCGAEDAWKSIPDNSVDSVVSDPSLDPQWGEDGPGVEHWTEMLRVLKPGGHAVLFGGKFFESMGHFMRMAGFEMRGHFSWVYGDGRPHSYDISMAALRAGWFKEAEMWKGQGTALKPTFDLAVVARKPWEGTNADPAEERFASRFFYSVRGGRFGFKRSTGKPIDLMQSIVRQVTPKGGTVLDPFASTGTTAEAALREGCSCMLIAEDEELRNEIRRYFSAEQRGLSK
jgi:DNA modification methylase